jgi:hypothetical protein
MQNFFTIFALLFALWMILQQWRISVAKEGNGSASDWTRIAWAYKWHMRGTVCLALVGVVLLLNTIVSMSSLFESYAGLLKVERSTLTIVVIGFLAGAFRLVLDRAFDEPAAAGDFFKGLFNSFRATRINPENPPPAVPADKRAKRTDTWLWMFVATVVLETLFSVIPPLHPANSAAARFWATMVNCALAFTYVAWIYVGLFRKMTEHHHFSGLAAREFLGGLFNDQIPFQAVIIGAKGSGKTAFVEGQDISQNEKLQNLEHTSEVRPSRFVTAGSPDGTSSQSCYVSLLDTPGEFLGDHITTVMAYRTDVLVLVINETGLDRAQLEERKNFNLADFDVLLNADEKKTKPYLEALRMAVKRDESGDGAVPAKELFKVRAFLLFVNSWDPDKKFRALVSGNEQFQALAIEIGGKFGAPPQNCFAVAGSATDQENARNLIVNLHRLRQMPSHKAVLQKMHGQAKSSADV